MTLVTTILAASAHVENNRTPSSVMMKAMEEIGELSTEVSIHEGMSYKEAGPDGIKGEAIDAVCALIDLIYVIDPNFTEDQMVEIARKKMAKWIDKEKGRK